jgi:hypothetical protein
VAARPRACLAVALAFVLAGCAGSSFTRQPDEALALGRTSYPEIRQRLGSPYREGTLVKNGKQLKTRTYAYATTGVTAAYDGVVATRSQGFYFFEDKLAGYEFVSTWKDDLRLRRREGRGHQERLVDPRRGDPTDRHAGGRPVSLSLRAAWISRVSARRRESPGPARDCPRSTSRATRS